MSNLQANNKIELTPVIPVTFMVQLRVDGKTCAVFVTKSDIVIV